MNTPNHNPALEKIDPSFGQSFTYKKFDDSTLNAAPFWHFHPELELVYIAEGSGKRHIGNHISYFNNGDLIFIGSNLPHYGFSDRLSGDSSEVVIQWKEDFLGPKLIGLPEVEPIRSLFARSAHGIVFRGPTKTIVGHQILEMNDMEPFPKLMAFMDVLHRLAVSQDYEILNASSVGLVVNTADSVRIDKVYNHVRKHFLDDDIPLVDVASLINMTIPSFCRYFKKHTSKTFTQFVNEFRIVHATKLLAESDEPIANVCYDSGFNNFSHFNRHFKRVTGQTPSEYRAGLNPVTIATG